MQGNIFVFIGFYVIVCWMLRIYMRQCIADDDDDHDDWIPNSLPENMELRGTTKEE